MNRLFGAAVLSLALAVSVFAQGLGTMGGTVVDPSGALIPGAKVTVTEVGTGLSRGATSDEQECRRRCQYREQIRFQQHPR